MTNKKKICIYLYGNFTENEGTGNSAVNITKGLKEFNITVLTPKKFKRLLFYSFLSPLWFAYKIKKINPDIVLVHCIESSFDPILAKKMFDFKYKVFVIAHGVNAAVLKEYLTEYKHGVVEWKPFYELNLKVAVLRTAFLQFADKVTSISQQVKKELNKYYGVDSFVITNGVVPFKKKHVRNKLDTILFVGNYWIKGLVYLIKANNSLNTPKEIVVVGLSEKDKQYVQKNNDCKHVKFISRVEHSEMENLYLKADVFVMPSVYESFGISYLEALSTGLPVMGCVDTGATEMIKNKSNGVLVLKRNPRAIIKGIEYCESNIKKLSKNSVFNKKYGWEVISKEYVKVLNSI